PTGSWRVVTYSKSLTESRLIEPANSLPCAEEALIERAIGAVHYVIDRGSEIPLVRNLSRLVAAPQVVRTREGAVWKPERARRLRNEEEVDAIKKRLSNDAF